LLIGLLEAGWRGHRPVIVASAAFLVTDPVQWGQHF